jgi:hypothetical protein
MSLVEDKPFAPRHLVGWKKGVAILVMLSFGMLAALAICEVAVRVFCDPLIMPRWVENAPYGIRKQVANIRGFIVTAQYRHNFATNSKGFRGTREYQIPKPAGVYRMLALGDSVVCGYGVEDDQTYCARLEKMAPGVEAVNIAIPGFGNAEELIQLENVGFEHQPDLVTVGYFINDPFENVTCGLYRLEDGKLIRSEKAEDKAIFIRDRLSRIPGYTFFCQHSYFLNFLRYKASGHFRAKAQASAHLPPGSYTTNTPEEHASVMTAALVDEIIRVCNERGVPILIFNIPMEVNGVWTKNMPIEKLKLKDKAKIVDVATEIWGQEDIWKIATPGSYHPKARGHELIAEWLAKYIETQRRGQKTATAATLK